METIPGVEEIYMYEYPENRRPSRNSRIVHDKDLLQVRITVYKYESVGH